MAESLSAGMERVAAAVMLSTMGQVAGTTSDRADPMVATSVTDNRIPGDTKRDPERPSTVRLGSPRGNRLLPDTQTSAWECPHHPLRHTLLIKRCPPILTAANGAVIMVRGTMEMATDMAISIS
jgi:hypothetical protein